MTKHWIHDVDESWTLFLDRDGVINQKIDGDYVKTVGDLDILPGVLEGFYLLKDCFYKIIIVTNQQGIGKGLMTHQDLKVVHDHLVKEIENANGSIDQIYYSPDLAYLNSFTRKPSPGMAMQAQQDFPYINFEKSIIIGDSQSDIDFGKALKMKSVWVDHHLSLCTNYDLKVKSLIEFCRLIIENRE